MLEFLPREQLGHNWSNVIDVAILQSIGLPIPAGGSSINFGPMVKGNGDVIELYEQFGMQNLQVWAPTYSRQKDITLNYVLADHRALNQILLDQTIAAGAEVKFEQEFQDLQVIGLGGLERVQVMGVYGKDITSGKNFALQANLVVDATGWGSVLRIKLPQSSGIAGRFNADDFNNVYRTIRHQDISAADEDIISNHHRFVFSGYTWTHIYDLATIEVGAMTANIEHAPNPTSLVSEYLFAHPSISITVTSEKLGLCLVGRSPLNLVVGGFMVLGDAAGQVNSMTAYGLSGGLQGSKLAAKTAITAATEGKNDIGTLWPYNYKWFAASQQGANYAALWIIQQVLRTLPTDDLEFLFQADILNKDFLCAALNGVYDIPTWQEKVISLMKGFTRQTSLLNSIGMPSSGRKFMTII